MKIQQYDRKGFSRFFSNCYAHCTNMKFSIKDFFNKLYQICRNLRNWSHLLKKFLMENLIFQQRPSSSYIYSHLLLCQPNTFVVLLKVLLLRRKLWEYNYDNLSTNGTSVLTTNFEHFAKKATSQMSLQQLLLKFI